MAMKDNKQYLTKEDKENILNDMRKCNLPFTQSQDKQTPYESSKSLQLKRDLSPMKQEELKVTFENRNLVNHVYFSNDYE